MRGPDRASWALESPVAFLIYNRPELTEAVFARIAAARPSRLLVIADGPRPDCPADAERCQAARRAVFERIDWTCEVHTNLSERNLGCRNRVATGLDWVFEQVDHAIILEDDCLPEPTLFRFFDEMLRHYSADGRVMMITGCNQVPGWRTDTQQYHFSAFPNLWGWASWRRAWRHYDVDMKLLAVPGGRERITETFEDPDLASYWLDKFDRVERGEIDTWDYQWLFACRLAGGLCVVPSVNLIANLGFGRDDATHTKHWEYLAAMTADAMRFPIHFHDAVAVDRDYDLRVPSARRVLARSLERGRMDAARTAFGRV